MGECRDSDIAKIVGTPDVSDAVRIVHEAVENAVGDFRSPICSCELATGTCIAVLSDFACKTGTGR